MVSTDESLAAEDPYEDRLAGELEQLQSRLESGIQDEGIGSQLTDLPPEVQSEFERSRRCLQLLHQSALLLNSSVSGSRPTVVQGSESTFPETLPPVPQHLGRFLIRERIGRGGFGIVYRAIDPTINREVAIKIPRPEILGERQLLDRFRNEGLAAARLDHPNIVTVYECGTDGIVPYLAMTYIPGTNLSLWRKSNPGISFTDIARITYQLASGVRHAHERGIVHRDLKPGNVLLHPTKSIVSREGVTFVPKITDFGLAKLRDVSHQSTMSGGMLGTLNYMSPEQAAGDTKSLDERTDIYGLGTILYELLTGNPPYEGENDIQTLARILKDDPRRVSQIRRDVPTDLELICHKCLERNRQDRYQTAGMLADDLDRYLSGRPLLAKRASFVQSTVKWSRRHPVAASVISLATFGTLVLLGVLFWFNAKLSDSLRVAEGQRNLARKHELEVRQRAYNSDMRLAQISWDQTNVDQTLQLLERHRPKKGEPDIRGFAWWYLWNEYQNSSQILGEHPGGASAVAISPDGKTAASGGEDAIIRLWSIDDRKLITELRGHTKGPLPALDFSPDGHRLVSAGEDGTVRLWDVVSGDEITSRDDHQEWVADVKFSSDGKTIASGGGDAIVRLWNGETLDPVGTLTGHERTIRSLVFHPRENLLISAAEDATIRFWNVSELNPDQRIPEGLIRIQKSADWPRTLAMDPKGESFICGLRHSFVQRYGLMPANFGMLLQTRENSSNPRCSTWPAQGGPTIGMTNTEIMITADENIQNLQESLKGHQDEILSLAGSHGRSFILSGGKDGEVRYWPLEESQQPIYLTPTLTDSGPASTFPFDEVQWRGEFIAGSLEEGVIELHDSTTRKLQHSFPVPKSGRFTLSPSGKLLLRSTSESDLELINVVDKQARWEARLDGSPSFLEIDQKDQVAGACVGKNLILLGIAETSLRTICEHPEKVYHVKFLNNEDGTTQAMTACADGAIRFWDVSTGKVLREKMLHPIGGMRVSTVSRDGKLIATGGLDRKARVLRLDDLQEIAVFSHSRAVTKVEFLNQGKTLGCLDDALYIWDITNQSQLMMFPSTLRGTYFAASPDGKQIAFQQRERIRILDGRAGSDPGK